MSSEEFGNRLVIHGTVSKAEKPRPLTQIKTSQGSWAIYSGNLAF